MRSDVSERCEAMSPRMCVSLRVCVSLRDRRAALGHKEQVKCRETERERKKRERKTRSDRTKQMSYATQHMNELCHTTYE